MDNDSRRKTTSGATQNSAGAGMSLEALREMFKRPPRYQRGEEVDRPLVQPTVKDPRGALIKIRAGKNDLEIKEELLELAQDLGWPSDVELHVDFGRHFRGRTKRTGWILLDGKYRETIFITSLDHVAITYCVPPHPNFQDGNVQRFMGMDVGKGGDVTAVTVAKREDGTMMVEDITKIDRAAAIAKKAVEIASAMGVSVREASEAINAATSAGPSVKDAITASTEFNKTLKRIEGLGRG